MKTNQERLAELLLDWEEAAERGEPVDTTALCHDCPELQPELERLIEILKKARWMDRLVEAEDQTAITSSPAETDSHHPPEFLAGRYQLLELLGEGGYSRVYRAFDQELHRQVAIKFPKHLKASEGLLREARRVVQLRHPAIVPVIDLGREGERIFIVSELITGGTLEQRLTRPVSRAEALRWGTEIAQALHSAHSQGVVHLDVKPANVLLDGEQRAMLTDFGIAASPRPNDALLQSKGTLKYMSPEQLACKPLDHRSDIYSLGVLLHELLTGKLPYTSTQPVELTREITAGRSQLLVSEEPLRALVQKALKLQPQDRFQSAAAIVEELRKIQTGRPRLSRRSFLGAATLGAATLGGGLAWRYQAAATEPARWLAAASAAEPETQIELVTQRLIRLNPGFTGKVESKIVDGSVQEWSMATDLITDLSPLQALPGLKKLFLLGTTVQTSDVPQCFGNIHDLSPLRGLQLETLSAPFNPRLRDISPLQGMPLKSLQISSSSVTDLSPLGGMPLEEFRAGNTAISDLTPLESAQLRTLTVDRTKVRRLPNLRQMPLEMVLLQFTPLESLDGIQGTPVQRLECHATPLSDLTPVKELRNLWGMTIYKTNITDLSPLIESGGMRILYCDYVPERDRAIIARIPRLEIVNDRPVSELLKADR